MLIQDEDLTSIFVVGNVDKREGVRVDVVVHEEGAIADFILAHRNQCALSLCSVKKGDYACLS